MKRLDFLNLARKNKKVLISILRTEKHRGGVMICRHNTILGIVMKANIELDLDESLSFVVNTTTDRCLESIESLGADLASERYTPEAAANWLKEDLELKVDGEDFSHEYKKVLLSELDLREIVKERLIESIKANQDIARKMKEIGMEEL